MRRALLFATLLLAALAAACGGEGRAPASPPASATTSPASPTSALLLTPSPEPQPLLVASSPPPWAAASCARAEPRDEAKRLALSLGDPICLEMRPNVGGAVVVSARLGGFSATAPVQQPAGRFIVLSGALSPYGPAGCAASANAHLNLTVQDASTMEVLLQVAVACGPTSDDELCKTQRYSPDGLFFITGPGDMCVSWRQYHTEAEAGYRLELTYPRPSLVFAFLLAASQQDVLVPHDAAPRLDESPARCLARRDFAIAVYSLPGDVMVSSGMVVSECSIY